MADEEVKRKNEAVAEDEDEDTFEEEDEEDDEDDFEVNPTRDALQEGLLGLLR